MSLRELAAAALRCLRHLEEVAAYGADAMAEFARLLARLVRSVLRVLRSLLTLLRTVVSGVRLSARLLAGIVETLAELPRVFSAASFQRFRQAYRRDQRIVEREMRRREREQDWVAAQEERAQGRRAQSPPPPPRYPLRRRFRPGRHSDPDEASAASTSSSDSTSSDAYLSCASPYIASRVENPVFLIQLEETTMRCEPRDITDDRTFEEADRINVKVLSSINEAATDWGLKCPRYEIRDIAMEMQDEAERRKRTQILESEGAMLDQANRAKGEKFEAVVPFMGESVTDGTLATFLKKPGDRVEADEAIAQIETDKVTIDVSSPEAGVLEKYIASEGDTVTPGTIVAIISRSEAPAETHVAPSEEATPKE